MNQSILLKTIKIVLILAAIGLGLWLINQNYPSSGQLQIEAVLGKDSPMISRLGPAVRVKIEKDYARVLETPIYFDLRSLPWFKQAQLELIFSKQGLALEGIGGQTAKGWQYDVQKPILMTDLGAGWQQAVFNFDLTKIYQQKNIRRFIISTQPTRGEGDSSLNIKSLKLILNR